MLVPDGDGAPFFRFGQLTGDDREERLRAMPRRHCPVCSAGGIKRLCEPGTHGFKNRAIHNLWFLAREKRLIHEHIQTGDFPMWSRDRLSQRASDIWSSTP